VGLLRAGVSAGVSAGSKHDKGNNLEFDGVQR